MTETIIRASSLPGYADCPRRWAAKTIRGEIEAAGFNVPKEPPKSIGASVGTATHSGAAYTMLEKMRTGEIGNDTEAEQIAIEDLDKETIGGVLWDNDTRTKNDAQKQIRRMVRSFREDLAPDLMPSAVERRLKADVGDGFILSGQSDMQLLSPDGIDDLKTGRRPSTHYAQLGTYSLLVRTEFPDFDIKQLRTLFVKRENLKNAQPKPELETYEVAVAEQAAVATIARLKQDVAEFRRRVVTDSAPPENAFLANPGSYLCSPKFCPAFGTKFCREHRKPKE